MESVVVAVQMEDRRQKNAIWAAERAFGTERKHGGTRDEDDLYCGRTTAATTAAWETAHTEAASRGVASMRSVSSREALPRHYGRKPPRIQTEVLGHSLVRSLVRLHRSLVRSLAHFAHSLARGKGDD